MTQAQMDAVNSAQQKFFAAAAANTAAQNMAADAAANLDAAHTNATVTVPAQCRQFQEDANAAFFKAQDKQQYAIAVAQKAQSDLSQAQVDLQAAILGSLQTGAVEKV